MSAAATSLVLRRVVQIGLGVAAFVAAWHLTIVGFGIPKYLAPLPIDVAESFRAHWTLIATQAGFTLSAAALGLCVSTLFASAIAISFSMSRKLAQASLPAVLVSARCRSRQSHRS